MKSEQRFFCVSGPGQTPFIGHVRERTLTCFPHFPDFGIHNQALQLDQTPVF